MWWYYSLMHPIKQHGRSPSCERLLWAPPTLAMFSHHLILSFTGARNHPEVSVRLSTFPSLCYDEDRHNPKSQLAHLIPLSGNIKQMSASKRNQSINHSLCVVLGEVGHKRRLSKPRTTHLTRSSFPQGMSIHHSSQKGLSSLYQSSPLSYPDPIASSSTVPEF